MATSIAENKKIVMEYFEAQKSGDLNKGFALFADDATWWIPGDWELAGTFDKETIVKMFTSLPPFEGGLHFTLHSVTAEEDRVAVLAGVKGKVQDGRTYTNHIFFCFQIQDGKIHRITEVVDSLRSKEFWIEGKP